MAATFRYYMYSNPRIIEVASPTTDVTVQEIVNDVRNYEDELNEAMQHDHLISAAGKEELGGGVQVGITCTFQNAKLRFEARNGPSYTVCNISGGNLVAVDEVGDALDPVAPSAFVTVVRTSSSSSTLLNQQSLESASFQGMVVIDRVNGQTDTDFPAGTRAYPVKKIPAALTIANNHNLHTLHFESNATILASHDVSHKTITGDGVTTTQINVASGADLESVRWRYCKVGGYLGGYALEFDKTALASVYNLGYAGGHVYESELTASIRLSKGGRVSFIDCVIGPYNEIPVLDCNDASRVNILSYSGAIMLKNVSLTGNTSVAVGLEGGIVILQPDLYSGTYTVTGDGTIHDFTTAASVNIIDDALLNRTQIASKTWSLSASGHTAADTMGGYHNDVHDEAVGKWILNPTTNKLYLYRKDGTTVLASFDLTATSGTVSPYVQRTPI